MQTIRFFIASSAELQQDRDDFRNFLSVENDRLHNKDIYLELVQWENFLDAVSETSLQDEYNKALEKCDVVICLFYKKAGKYTQAEFDAALKQFKNTGKPLIYTYFKESEETVPEITSPKPAEEKTKQDLIEFKKKLSELGHFYTHYKSIEDLKYQFLKQLDRMEDKGIIKVQEEVKTETSHAVNNYFTTNNTTNQTADKIYNIDKIDSANFS